MADKAGLFERMLAEAEAAFALAAASEGIVVAQGRESDLVTMAMQAGVVGALSVDREEDVPDDIVTRLDEILTILRNPNR